MDKQIQGNSYFINYQVLGAENLPPLLALHGYGLNYSSWNVFLPLLTQHYKVIAFNLPFHQTSTMNGVRNHRFADIVSVVMEKEAPGKKYDILAYSLGANYAWHLLEHCSGQINRVLLLAPDGLKSWDHKRFLRYNIFGKTLCSLFIYAPLLFSIPIKILHRLDLIPVKNRDFYLSNMATKANRKRLIQRWRNVAELQVRLKKAINQAIEKRVQIHVVMGRFDSVIHREEGLKLTNLIKVTIEDIGHNMLIKKAIPIIDAWVKSGLLPQNNK